MKRVLSVPLELICPNPNQPRKTFNEEELVELSKSIKEYGVIQPVIVKKDKYGLYILIAGERRFKAAELAGLKKIPAILREDDEKDSAILALVENVQREDLNYMEEAFAYKNLMDEFGLTQVEIAKRVGKKQSTISNKIRLLALPAEIQKALVEHKMTERHARALLKISDEELRKKVVERIASHALNVKQTEKLVDDVLIRHEEELRKRNRVHYINYRIYVNSIRKLFGEINEKEKEAKYFQEDKGEYFEVRIVLPKQKGDKLQLL